MSKSAAMSVASKSARSAPASSRLAESRSAPTHGEATQAFAPAGTFSSVNVRSEGEVRPLPGLNEDAAERQAERFADSFTGTSSSGTHASNPTQSQPANPYVTALLRTGVESGSAALPAHVATRASEAGVRNADQVRVHRNSTADSVNRLLSSNGYAYGNHVVLSSSAGERTLAHELAHVGQFAATGSAAAPAARFNLKTYLRAINQKPEPDWATAAEHLNGETPKMIKLMLSRLDKPYHVKLHIAALKWPGICSNVARLTEAVYLKEHPGAKTADAECKAGPEKPAAKSDDAASKSDDTVMLPSPPTTSEKPGSEFVSKKFGDVRFDSQYIDNFSNDLNYAWLPNDRVFAFEYPNGAVLKVAYVDLLKALNVKSDLNPQPSDADVRKKYKVPDGLTPPTSDIGSPFVTMQPTTFHRDKESGVIYPQADRIARTYLPRIANAIDQIEPTRTNEELWQKAAPKILEAITNMEFGAPRGFGSLIVSIGKRGKGTAKKVAQAVTPKAKPPANAKPPVAPKVTAPHGAAPSGTPPKEATAPAAAKKGANDLIDNVTKETKDLYKRRPELKASLQKNQRAAAVLKECNSPCFPDFVTHTQLEEIEAALIRAEQAGFPIDRKKAMQYFRSVEKVKKFKTNGQRRAELQRRIDGFDDMRKDLSSKNTAPDMQPDPKAADATGNQHQRTQEYDPKVGDSTRLGENLTKAKRAKPGESHQAHHIIPSNEGPQELRDLLAKHRLDINGEHNGVWLPTGRQRANAGAEYKHELVTSSPEYFSRLHKLLVTKPPLAKTEFVSRLRAIGEFLKDGKLPPHNLFKK